MTALMDLLVTFVGAPGTSSAAGSGMLGIWQSVINFAMTEGNELVLLSILAWLFVMGVGGIRKLVVGL